VAIDPSCAYLASYAVDVLRACCAAQPPWGLDCYGSGQVFDSDGYNVIVSAQVRKRSLCWVGVWDGVADCAVGLLRGTRGWRLGGGRSLRWEVGYGCRFRLLVERERDSRPLVLE